MINKILDKEFSEVKKILNLIKKNKFSKIKNFFKLVNICEKTIKNGNKIIFFGNGGSASDSQHLATELVVRYKNNRKAIPALALSSDNSIITATGNDFGFKYIFSRQMEAIGIQNDVAICLTTSGNSENTIQAFKMAKKKNIITACFSGNKGGKIKKYSDIPIIIPSKTTSTIQVIELMLGQILCDYLERKSN